MSKSPKPAHTDWRYLPPRLHPTLMLVVCLGGILIALPGEAPISSSCGDKICSVSTAEELRTQPQVLQLYYAAQGITVKVLAGEVLGSGILIQKQGQVYTVLTNAHVLRAGTAPYQIETPDGRLYPAGLPKDVEASQAKSLQGHDLGLLQFCSPGVSYTAASVGASSTLAVGDEVFAAGFPFTAEASNPGKRRLVFTKGQVSLVLNKALEGGYTIGNTSRIRKGMSGGPLLNRWGEVVGINGMHANPLWDAPDVFQDGSSPDQPLQELITRSSWAVAIETATQDLGQVFLPHDSQATQTTNSSLDKQVPPQTLQMGGTKSWSKASQAEATKNCTLFQSKFEVKQ